MNNVIAVVTNNIAPNHLNTLLPIANSNNAINQVLTFPSLTANQLLS